MRGWSVIHVGIGRIEYDSEAEARFAAGDCGRLQTRDDPEDSCRDVPLLSRSTVDCGSCGWPQPVEHGAEKVPCGNCGATLRAAA